MAKEIILTPDGAKVLKAMIASCGTSCCFEAARRLAGVEASVKLSEIGTDNSGSWLMAAFSRLAEFAHEEEVETLDRFEVARYFGGRVHIRMMNAIADHTQMGKELGPCAGLVSHILLPLDKDFFYRNAGCEVRFGPKPFFYNQKEPGIPCYHLGLIVNIELTEDQAGIIKKEQSESETFMNALAKIKGPIIPTEEYAKALLDTVAKAGS